MQSDYLRTRGNATMAGDNTNYYVLHITHYIEG